MQPCSQEQNLKEIQKDVQLSKERDVLQSEQIINMQKDITNINTKVDKLDIKMDKGFLDITQAIIGLDNKFAKKESVSRLWIIVWSIIGFVFTTLGVLLATMIKYFLSLGIK